jgi:hypothetical protein
MVSFGDLSGVRRAQHVILPADILLPLNRVNREKGSERSPDKAVPSLSRRMKFIISVSKTRKSGDTLLMSGACR